MSEKLILTDCDGVLLDWQRGYEKWMGSKGFLKVDDYDQTAYGLHIHYGIPKDQSRELVRQFNTSASIGFLEPFDEAVKYTTELFLKGYRFVVITSLSKDEHAIMLREMNLDIVFGRIFQDVICLDTGADKDEALAQWVGKAKYWVEDKFENAVVGADLGFETFMIEHEHNKTETHKNIQSVDSWKEIYESITK